MAKAVISHCLMCGSSLVETPCLDLMFMECAFCRVVWDWYRPINKGAEMTLIRISPDGSEVKHLYSDAMMRITSKTSDISVSRASDLFFDDFKKKWKIRVVATGEVVNKEFSTRAEAINYEVEMLEEMMRAGIES